MIDLFEIGEHVRQARREKRWTQAVLANASGVSRARIDALENGRASEFGVRHLLKIFEALDLDFRIGPANNRRPTLDDLTEETDNASRMGR